MMSTCIVDLYYGCNSVQFSLLSCIWLITCHFMHPSSCIWHLYTRHHASHLSIHLFSVSHLGYDPSHVVKSCISHVIMYLASCIHLFQPMIICIALMTWCIPCNQVLHFICRHATYIMHTYVSYPDCMHMHSKKPWSFWKKSTNLCVTNQVKKKKIIVHSFVHDIHAFPLHKKGKHLHLTLHCQDKIKLIHLL
jgi:hypothetical protein